MSDLTSLLVKFPEDEFPGLAQFLSQRLEELEDFTPEEKQLLIDFWELITENNYFYLFFNSEDFEARYFPDGVISGGGFINIDTMYDSIRVFISFIN